MRQSKKVNPKTLATLGTQDTEQRLRKANHNTQKIKR